jgi:hypothetical protein
VSFRTNAEESAHWETYGRASTGFALAFALKPLVIPGILAFPVLYDPEAQEKFLGELSKQTSDSSTSSRKNAPLRNSELSDSAQSSGQRWAFGLLPQF